MYSIKVEISPSLTNFLNKYPQLYEDARKKATEKSLNLLVQSIQTKVMNIKLYQSGQLHSGVGWREKSVFAGLNTSNKYAKVQEFGGPLAGTKAVKGAGQPGWKYIKPKKYFYSTAEAQKDKILNFFVDSFKELLARV